MVQGSDVKAKKQPKENFFSDSDEGDDGKAADQAPKKTPVEDKDDSDDDSDVDVVPAGKATAKSPASKQAAASKSVAPAEDSDDSDATVVPAKATAGAQASKQAATSKPIASEEDSDDSDADVVTTKEATKAAAKSPASKQAEGSKSVAPAEADEDSEADVPAAKGGAKATTKAEADDDDDDDDDGDDDDDDDEDDGEEAQESTNKNASTQGTDSSFKVVVRGLPWSITRKSLKDDWSECGEISQVEMGQPGMAMLTFKTEEAVKNALKLHGAAQKYKGFKLKVRQAGDKSLDKEGSKACNVITYKLIQDLMRAETSGNFEGLMGLGRKIKSRAQALSKQTAKAQRKEKKGNSEDAKKMETAKKIEAKGEATLTVRVSNLPFALKDEGELKKYFSSHCGEVETIELKKMLDGRFKGIAFILFSSKEAVEKAIACNGKAFAGREIRVERANDRLPSRVVKKKVEGEAGSPSVQKAEHSQDILRVRVSNLPFTLTDDGELKKHFAKCGKVSSLTLNKRANGSSKGFATMVLSSKEAVDKAIACSGEEFAGRKLRVARVGEKSEDEASKTPTKRKAESNNDDTQVDMLKQDASAKKKKQMDEKEEAEEAPAKKKPRKDTEAQAESHEVEKKASKSKQAEDTPSKKAEGTPSKKAEDTPSKKAEDTPSKKKKRKDMEEQAINDASKEAEDTPSKKAEETPSKKEKKKSSKA